MSDLSELDGWQEIVFHNILRSLHDGHEPAPWLYLPLRWDDEGVTVQPVPMVMEPERWTQVARALLEAFDLQEFGFSAPSRIGEVHSVTMETRILGSAITFILMKPDSVKLWNCHYDCIGEQVTSVSPEGFKLEGDSSNFDTSENFFKGVFK